jgi:hypothetical protein
MVTPSTDTVSRERPHRRGIHQRSRRPTDSQGLSGRKRSGHFDRAKRQ